MVICFNGAQTSVKTMIDIKLQISMPTPEPKGASESRLLAKVEHAIDCIELGQNKEQAISFIREVSDRLSALPKMTEKQQYAYELCKPVLANYGAYHKGSKNA